MALRHLCVEAVDIAKGCENCLDLKLPTAAATLNHALFERFIYAIWVAQAEENGLRYAEAALEEGARQLRKMLESGVGKIVRESLGEDCTAEFRKSDTKKLRHPPGFLEMARSA